MSKYYDPEQLPKEPVHIIIDGIGGLHCNNNEKVLEDRIKVLENIIKRNIDKLKNLDRELDNPTSDIAFAYKFKNVLSMINYDSRIAFIEPREYYPNMRKDEGSENDD